MAMMGNMNSGEFQAPKEDIEWDLWQGKKTFRLEYIQHCIEKNLIWDFYVSQFVLSLEPGAFYIDKR